jgi:hypothetical protein
VYGEELHKRYNFLNKKIYQQSSFLPPRALFQQWYYNTILKNTGGVDGKKMNY